MESATQQAQAEAAVQAKQIRESSQAELSALQAQLSEKEQLLQTKQTAVRELEHTLSAKVQELEAQLKEKVALLERLNGNPISNEVPSELNPQEIETAHGEVERTEPNFEHRGFPTGRKRRWRTSERWNRRWKF